MKLTEQIDKDYLEAYKAHNDAIVAVLRILKSDLKNTEIAKKTELEDQDVTTVIKKQIKQRRDTIEIYSKSGKEDAAALEQKEIDVLSKYMPEQLSEEDTKKIVEDTINELGIKDKSQLGQLIGAVISKSGGKADGGTVAKIANQVLNKN